VLALLRDRTFAHAFGAGQVLDLYYAAFRVPDLVFAVVSSLVSAYVLIPYIAKMDREETERLISETSSFLVGAGGVICIGLALYMPQFLSWLYPTLMQSPLQADFVLLGRMLLVQPILLGLSGVLSSVTQVHRRFFLFALSPVLYNLGIIIGSVFFYPVWGLPGLGIGVIIGAVAYLAANVPVLIESHIRPRLVMPSFRRMASIVHHSVPRSLALGMNSITALFLTAIASGMGSGAVSVFTFANNLQAVPLALIGSSYAVAAFPALSEAHARDERSEFTRILSASARHIVLWSMVAFGLIVVLRAHLVRVILGSGAFDWDATRTTAALLAVLTIGLAADALELLFNRALYAARQSWRPLMYQVSAGVVTVALFYYLDQLAPASLLTPLAAFLKVSDVHQVRILLVALASALGQLFLVSLSLMALRSVAPGLSRSLLVPLRDGTMAAVVGGAAAYGVLALLGEILPLTTLATVFLNGLLSGCVGLVAAGLVLYILNNPEFAMVLSVALRFFREPRRSGQALQPSGEEPIQP
jgi:putative peptidoglycan lipid II flippase